MSITLLNIVLRDSITIGKVYINIDELGLYANEPKEYAEEIKCIFDCILIYRRKKEVLAEVRAMHNE